VLDSRYYRYHSSEPDQGSADPKAYFDEWPENADISGTKEKKVGPGNRKYITQYFRAVNIFDSNFDK